MSGFFASLPRPASEVENANFTGRMGEPGAAYLLAKQKVMALSDEKVASYKSMPPIVAAQTLNQTNPTSTPTAPPPAAPATAPRTAMQTPFKMTLDREG